MDGRWGNGNVLVTAALLSLTLLWSPVTIDCLGGPESGVVYEVSYMYRVCETVGLDEPPPCATFFVRFETDETRWETTAGEPDPPPGAGYWYQVSDHDGAGNWSDDPCW